MSIALPDKLNYSKNMPIDENCKQQMTVAVPCTGANAYNPETYFIINLPRDADLISYLMDLIHFYVFK